MSTTSIAVIGAGHLGRIHARLLAAGDHGQLHSIVDPDTAARQALAEQHGVNAFASWTDVVDKIDAAIIAAPTIHHAEIAEGLIAEGKHLLIEKPLASSASAAASVVELARQKGTVIQSGHCERFNPAYQALRPQVHNPRLIQCDRSGPYPFRSTDVGVVFDLMIHDIDLTLDLVGAEVMRIDAVGGVVIGPHEDWAQARLEYSNGAVAQLSACRTAIDPSRCWTVHADGVYAEADFASGSLRVLSPGTALSGFDPNALTPTERDDWKTRLFDDLLKREDIPGEGNAILEEQRDFIDAIEQQRPPRAAGEHAARAIDVAERVLHQIHRRAWNPLRKAG